MRYVDTVDEADEVDEMDEVDEVEFVMPIRCAMELTIPESVLEMDNATWSCTLLCAPTYPMPGSASSNAIETARM